MRRREFVSGLVGAAAWPLPARSQRASPPRIGVLLVGLSRDSKAVQHFQRGLGELGYAEGRDIVIDWRSAEGDYDRVPKLVAELVQSRVEAFVMDSTFATEVAKRSTSQIPIVMALVLDPVGSGLINSLTHPGGNVTGLSMMATELYPKRLQLLKEVTPELRRVAVLWNPDHSFHARVVEQLNAVGPSLSLELTSAPVRMVEEFGPAFAGIDRAKAQALYVVEDPTFFANRTIILDLAASMQLPTVHETRRWPEAGALLAYGPDLHDLFRRAAIYVDRILKGARPADLPVEQPTKFELVMNLKTAKALGLTLPLALQASADEVIE